MDQTITGQNPAQICQKRSLIGSIELSRETEPPASISILVQYPDNPDWPLKRISKAGITLAVSVDTTMFPHRRLLARHQAGICSDPCQEQQGP